MTSIVEVPIEGEAEGEALVAPEAVVVAKKRGRPKGALNKPKAAPAPTPTPAATVPKKRKAPPPSDSEEEPMPVKAKKKRVKAPPPSSDEEPPTPRRSRQRTISPTPVMDTRQVASEVLQLLSDRHLNQSTARREKYKSWFQ